MLPSVFEAKIRLKLVNTPIEKIVEHSISDTVVLVSELHRKPRCSHATAHDKPTNRDCMGRAS